ncbi:MAG TPA: LLM class flavin-dependent oxidoreductase [Acidimicrobiia bacterium]|nr:LLM class flavin-dependent oxidoreductase [Acidimicrobiia bacterium]
MEFGLFLQPLHHPSEDPTEALERDLDLVVLLEELGFDDAWIGEHHSTGWENIASPEAFIAAAAQRTERIRLGTGVIQLGLHHPLVVLDRMIFLDHLTRGRVSFGMGIGGGIPSDLAVFGLSPEDAGRRMQESIEVMIELLESNGPVSARTDWFTLDRAELQMRPFTEPHMALAVASTDPRNVEFMGRTGGEVLVGGIPHRVRDILTDLERGAAEAGRTASRSQIKLSYVLHLAETTEEAEAGLREGAIREFYEFQVGVNGRPRPEGSPEDWYRTYLENQIIGSPDYAIARITEIEEISGGIGGMIFMNRDWAGTEANLRSWRLFAEEVAPRFPSTTVLD